MRKALHIVIAVLVFASSTFMIAPMAFCRMEAPAAEPTSCCEQPVKEMAGCNANHDQCPICSFELCSIDPTPAQSPVEKWAPIVDFVQVPVAAIAPVRSIPLGYVPVEFIEGGPPIFLLDRVLRI